MNAPELSPAEREIVDRFDSAPDPYAETCGSKVAWRVNGLYVNVACSLAPHDDRDHEAHIVGNARGQMQATSVLVTWTRPSDEAEFPEVA